MSAVGRSSSSQHLTRVQDRIGGTPIGLQQRLQTESPSTNCSRTCHLYTVLSEGDEDKNTKVHQWTDRCLSIRCWCHSLQIAISMDSYYETRLPSFRRQQFNNMLFNRPALIVIVERHTTGFWRKQAKQNTQIDKTM